MKGNNKFTCIECGEPAPDLYTDFNGGIIRIEHCVCISSRVAPFI